MDWFVKAFLKASLVWLVLGVTLGVAMAAHPVWTVYRPAHMHMVLLGFVTGDWSYRAAVMAAMANYFIFFGADMVREARDRSETQARRRKFEAKAKIQEDEPMHQCHICGKTELKSPDLEFRVARDGHEYCLEHIPKTPVPPHQQAR